jgi:DNA-binding response OmpR family regulator
MDWKKILIVDDNRLKIATIEQALLRDGFQVIWAQDEDRALKATKKSKPDLIIFNAESESLDAVRFLQSLRQTERTRGVSLLFITEAQQHLQEKIGMLAPKNFIAKTFTREQLAIAVQENLKGAQKKSKQV